MSASASARLFVAVDPPAAVCDELAAWAREALGGLRALDGEQARTGGFGRIRLLAPDTMHVTLCFLGARPPAEIETIAAALQECPAGGVELSLGAPLWLPPRRPRALALAVSDPAGELERLHESVCEAISRTIDWRPERRRVRAHVTLARLARLQAKRERRRRREPGSRELAERTRTEIVTPVLAPTPQLSFRPSELVLYRSRLAREGASYEALATRALV